MGARNKWTFGAALCALSVWVSPVCGQSLRSFPEGGSVPRPPAYDQRLREEPRFFSLQDGWTQRTHAAIQTGSPLSGNLPVLLIQGLFSDSPEPHITQQDLQNSLFSGPSEFGTLTEYYDEVSGGRLTVGGEALPWVRTTISMSEAVGTSYGLGGDAKTGEFLVQALAGVDDLVDFGRFDNDGPDGIPNSGDDDGYVDAVAFQFIEVSASCGGPGIWPHRSRIQYWFEPETPYGSNDPRTGGGFIRVNDYTTQSAVDCGGVDVQKATTIAHELGHVLGLPDLYDRSQGLQPEQRRWVVGCWDLMAAGAWGCGTSNREGWVRPTHLGAWEKIRLGWLGGLEVVPGVLDQEFTLDPVQTSGQALKVFLEEGSPSGQTEYLLIEYRKKMGFDQDLPAAGVLVYHVDPKINSNRPCDSCPQTYMVELLEADGNNTLRLNFLQGGNRGEAGDAWGVSGPGKLTNNTYPSTNLTSGEESVVTIYDIFIQEGKAHVTLSSKAIPRTRLAQPFLNVGGLAPTQEEIVYLDGKGNQNGLYDVGDLRAYLKR